MNSKTTTAHRVVIVLGTNYSGSHLLSHLLSAHSTCFGVGELHRFQQLVESSNSAPVVSEYSSSPLFAGLNEAPVEKWYAILSERFAAQERVREPVIIDNSKKVGWVRRVAARDGLEVHLVHLLRDPRALVLRWLNTYDTEKRRRTQRLRVARRMPARAAQILTGDWVKVFVYKWLRENQQITRFLARNDYPYATVTYRDMVFATEAMLQRLMPELGLSYEPSQLKFGDNEQFGTAKTAYADAIKQSKIRPDLKWHTQLDASAAETVVANGDVESYLSSLGLHCGEKGLEREA